MGVGFSRSMGPRPNKPLQGDGEYRPLVPRSRYSPHRVCVGYSRGALLVLLHASLLLRIVGELQG
jgi:hypothetical protein